MHRVTGAEKQSGLPTFGARVGSRMINTLTRRMCFSTPRACFQLGILLFVPAPTLTALDVARRAPIGKDLPSQIDHYVSGGGWVSAVTGRPLQAHESKQQQDSLNTGQNTGSSIQHSVGAGESKTPQRPIFSPFIQQPGGTFDPKAIDFSALQLPNTPPKTPRNKKNNLHKATSSASSLSSLASSLHSQIN